MVRSAPDNRRSAGAARAMRLDHPDGLLVTKIPELPAVHAIERPGRAAAWSRRLLRIILQSWTFVGVVTAANGLAALVCVLYLVHPVVALRLPCEIAFAGSFMLTIALLVHSTLTRHLRVPHALFGVVVAGESALAVQRDAVPVFHEAAVGLPIVCWFVFWGWSLAVLPQQVGEAVRAPRAFAECGPVSRASTLGVLLVEFVQLNALAFNPAIGGWSAPKWPDIALLHFSSDTISYDTQVTVARPRAATRRPLPPHGRL